MKHKLLLATLIAALPMMSQAHNLTLGQTAPSVTVSKHGEIILQGKDTAYQRWNSEKVLGKVHIIQAIAGRSSAKELNAPLISAITAAKFDAKDYQTITLINQDDSMWGTGSFVKSSAEKSKKEFPWSSLVLDEKGTVAKAWDLAPENSAIIVQDKQGKVLFVKEGALSPTEIKLVIDLVKANI